MTALVPAWQKMLNKIQIAAINAQRDPATIQLLAVSKMAPLSAIQTLLSAGQQRFGESYAQSLRIKAAALPEIEWHFIGPLQSNKTKIVAEYASWVQSIDRPKILQRLSAQRPSVLPALNICLEVNVSGEATKSGVSPQALLSLAQAARRYDNLRLRGLMCIPEATRDRGKLQAQFAKLRHLYELLNQQGFALDTLSMGMTHDVEIAIAEGSNMVRIGTGIFGQGKGK